MEIDVDTSAAYTVARLKGEFGMDDGQAVLDELQPLVAEAGAGLALVLDEVSYINSSGLNALIGLGTRARLSQGRLVLVAPSKFVQSVFEVTQLDAWFEVCKDLDEAADRLS